MVLCTGDLLIPWYTCMVLINIYTLLWLCLLVTQHPGNITWGIIEYTGFEHYWRFDGLG